MFAMDVGITPTLNSTSRGIGALYTKILLDILNAKGVYLLMM
jgi:hypothetical protein